MGFHLAVTPAGRITAVETDTDDDVLNVPTSETNSDLRLEKRIARLLAACQAEGLFTLAAERANRLKPSFEYWRGFASRYLTQLCHVPQTSNASFEEVAPPTSEEMVAMLLNVPPMQGAEYLTESVLRDIWIDLDNWVRSEAAAHRDGLSGFLQKRASIWHQVGRVCFHLAENRRDPDYPFAFLATYAPSLTAGARIQYKPLSESLREYAGAKNKKALIKLLSPVQLAAEKSELAKELVASGDLYQPLAWTPREAHRFLKEIPLFEESGLLVRVPDWWQKRSRPRVGITIGEKKRNTFNTDAMLDFQVTLALGDQELTESEWNELMQADEGLALLKGQWVEVDREKLAQALDHWKKLEEDATRRFVVCRGHASVSWRSHGPHGAARRGSMAPVGICRRGQMAWTGASRFAGSGQPSGTGTDCLLEGDAARVPGNGRGLASFPVQIRAGGVPGGRHGVGQDDPGIGSLGDDARNATTESSVTCCAGVATRQLEVGNGTIHSVAPHSVHPSFGGIQGEPGKHIAASGPRVGRH